MRNFTNSQLLFFFFLGIMGIIRTAGLVEKKTLLYKRSRILAWLLLYTEKGGK
jgi:hypothetical protein